MPSGLSNDFLWRKLMGEILRAALVLATQKLSLVYCVFAQCPTQTIIVRTNVHFALS